LIIAFRQLISSTFLLDENTVEAISESEHNSEKILLKPGISEYESIKNLITMADLNID
jgi:hypothetical protein